MSRAREKAWLDYVPPESVRASDRYIRTKHAFDAGYRAAIAATREECAEIAESKLTPALIAAAIRAGGEG